LVRLKKHIDILACYMSPILVDREWYHIMILEIFNQNHMMTTGPPCLDPSTKRHCEGTIVIMINACLFQSKCDHNKQAFKQ
jgi:hypothetical protein